jgi:hypothetical protein
MLFEDETVTPSRLDLWREGPGGGSVTQIAELAGGPERSVSGVRFSANGGAILFRSDAAIPGGFKNSGGFNQIYRYELSADVLDCVSCPSQGAPNGDARISYDDRQVNGLNRPGTTIDTRGMSSDGARVFFDTPAALVPQDVNGTRDVYEWQNGTVYLISLGSGPEESYYLDNDRSGENVFLATINGLVPGDTDEVFDVYDARIPRSGDNPPPPVVPCKGSVCQGPPSVPQLLGAPASETFSGAGNVTPPAEAVVKAKPKKKHKAKRHRRKKARGGARGASRSGVARRSSKHGMERGN